MLQIDPQKFWTPQDESAFQAGIRSTPWFNQFVQEYGEEPDLDTPLYNYRLAWARGLRPEPNDVDGRYHWPSSTDDGQDLKSPDHPTYWKEQFFRRTGVNPDDIDLVLRSKNMVARPDKTKVFIK